jgi:HlyD family secretion protein
VNDNRAVAAVDVERQQYLVAQAKHQLEESQAQLSQVKAGAWQYDLAEAQAGIKEAKASIQATHAQLADIQTQLGQAVVKAPKAGKVLQLNVHLGETYQLMMPGKTDQQGAVLLGDTRQLQVRVDVDEVMASEVTPNMPAMAFVKGNSRLQFPLEFERIAPFMVPKRSLAGTTAERNDVRVLQVIYRFLPPNGFTVYPGQQVEVYLQKTPRALSSTFPLTESSSLTPSLENEQE